jgi:hypothetical protein
VDIEVVENASVVKTKWIVLWGWGAHKCLTTKIKGDIFRGLIIERAKEGGTKHRCRQHGSSLPFL